MKISIIGISKIGGGYLRSIAYKTFLESKNFNVDLILIPNKHVSKIWFYYQSVLAKVKGKEIKLMNTFANKFEKIIKKNNYDVVIGVGTKLSYVLTKEIDCLKIFSYEAPEADELTFSNKKIEIERIKKLREMEIDIMQNSDVIVFPWKTTENYVKKNTWNGKNFTTIKFGCYPKNKTVTYFFPPSIIYLGTLRPYWTNKKLLSNLTSISPYIIDVYSSYRPERKYKLNYKGFANSLDVFYDYQFGLNTVSKDILRRNHFSSKVLNYLAYGLPVLFPEWMKFPKELKGCIAYNKDNFLEVVKKYSDKNLWEKMSEEAIKQAHELDWNITLKPLEKIIEKYFL